eukprot:TRINITY_DN3644_c0_g1_i1.p1 TRINITY_DN3644_c0_g1~~TRINITY_DN3644_c0_g1_i1.p1  ORF type:complete len:192 (+),score=26.16 TRINITY_DN3644_c0_g1_i1:262-837(+)
MCPMLNYFVRIWWSGKRLFLLVFLCHLDILVLVGKRQKPIKEKEETPPSEATPKISFMSSKFGNDIVGFCELSKPAKQIFGTTFFNFEKSESSTAYNSGQCFFGYAMLDASTNGKEIVLQGLDMQESYSGNDCWEKESEYNKVIGHIPFNPDLSDALDLHTHDNKTLTLTVEQDKSPIPDGLGMMALDFDY